MTAKKTQIISTVVVAALIAVTAFGFMFEKKGMFLDEIYSYGLSNSHYAPFMNTLNDGNLVGSTLTGDDFNDYLTVQQGELFDIGSVLYNQTQDVHPPLYYLLLNAASSFTPNEFSMWTGLLLGLPIWLLTGFLLYLLVKNLTGRWDYSLLAVGLWMLSQVGLSTLLMIRMYVLLTFFTVLLGYLLDRIFSGHCTVLSFLTVGVVIFAGCLTQYFFAFYAFFACLACGIGLLRRKCIKQAFVFAVCVLMGVALFLIVWPVIFSHLFAGGTVSGAGVLGSAISFFSHPGRIVGSMLLVLKGIPVASIILLVAFVVLVCNAICKRCNKDCNSSTHQISTSFLRTEGQNHRVLAVIIPAILAWVVVVILSPYQSLRYVYNLMPFVALAAVCALPIIRTSRLWSFIQAPTTIIRGKRFKVSNLLGGGVVILCTLCLTIAVQPDYLYRQFAEYNQAIAEHIDNPCVYYTENCNPAITSDILQLQQFSNVYVTNSVNVVDAGLLTYLSEFENPDQIIVYVDTYHGSSNYDARSTVDVLADYLNASNSTQLYKGDYSEAWLISGDDK